MPYARSSFFTSFFLTSLNQKQLNLFNSRGYINQHFMNELVVEKLLRNFNGYYLALENGNRKNK